MHVGDVDGPPIAIRVRNLSASGLMAETAAAPAPGVAVVIDLRNIGAVSGIVAWSDQGRFGITFDEPIDPRLARKPVGTHANEAMLVRPSSTKARRPGLRIE
jgi:hypothetical protein